MKNSEISREQLINENKQLKAKLAELEKTQSKQKPFTEKDNISFIDLFDLKDIQKLQDEFSSATGVASIITDIDGLPITKESNFTHLCKYLIRKTKKGLSNCYKSDAVLGKVNLHGPCIQPCLSGGLWDAGAGISAGGKHIANWLIGQVRDETQTEDLMIQYAKEIGVEESTYLKAFYEVPSMSHQRFEQIARMLFTLANQLSEIAYQSLQKSKYITMQKKIEQELKDSEEKFRNIINNSPDINYRTDIEGNITFISPSIQMLAGYTVKEITGKRMADFYLNPEERENFLSILREKGFVKNFEARIKRKNGTIFWVSTSSHFLKDKAGNIIGVEGSARDVTERKMAEEALLESEAHFHIALDNSPIVVFNQDLDLRYTWIHNTAPGFDSQTVLGKTDYELLNEDEAARLTEIKRRVLETGIKAREEVQTTIDGQIFFYDLTVEPLRDMNGNTNGVACASIDITERKQAEEKLKRSEVQLRLITDNLPILICQIDKNFKYLFVNKIYYERSLFSSNIIGKDVIDVMGEESFNRALPYMKKALTGEYVTFENRTTNTKNNELIIFETNYIPHIADGKIESFFVLGMIITERKLAEENLKSKVKQLEMMNNIMVERELTLNDTRKEVNELLAKLGEEEKYRTI